MGYSVRIVSNISDNNLRAGPLTTAAEDQRLYLRRPIDDRLDAVLPSQYNVLIGARRGSGATSLLNRLEGEQPDPVLVNAEGATDPWQVLQAIATRASIPRQLMSELIAPFQRVDPLAAPRALREMTAALRSAGRHLTVLLDGPINPQVAYTLFGRLRDPLFELPITWVVIANQEKMAEYLTPPADVFFEVTDRMDDLTEEDITRLLRLRCGGHPSPPSAQKIASASDGNPRRVLALARTLARRPNHPGMAAHAQATSTLSRGASMLLAEMQGRGPVAVTEPELSKRLGVSSREMRRRFAELQEAGLVEVVPGGQGQPGRPPTTFALTPLGAFAQGEHIGDRAPEQAP